MTDTAVDMEGEENEEIDRQLTEVKRKSSQKLAENMEATKSAYVIQEGGNPDAFCSETISWYNPWLRNFETALCFLVVLCLFFNSYMFFFVADMLMYNTAVAADVFYIFHMFLRSRTGHMIDGVEERNLYKIRERYQSSIAFYLDLLSMIPLSQMSVFLPGSPQLYYALGRQKQYVRLQFVLYYLGIREEEPGSSTFIYRSLKYVLLSLLTIHFLACGWYGLACSRYDESGFDLSLCGGRSWIMHLPRHIIEKVLEVTTNENAAMNSEVSFLHNTYVTSLYWSTATATSTGYGDVHAWTIEEKVYSIFAMIIGMLVLYGMTMGGMTSMLTNMDARRASFVQRYKAFETEVEKMGITDNVKDLCLRSFDYFWHRWSGENVQGSGFLKILPEALRASFAEATFHRLVRKADLLKNTEDAFCRNLALVSQPMVYLENQFVQRSGEIASNMCYIQHGIVEVLDADEEEVVAMMHSGKLFGQILLVFDLPRINSIRCKTNCDIFVLNKHDFRMVLSDYPDAAKQFCDAAREKCEGPDKQWPMEPPDFSDFNNFIEKTSAAKRRHTVMTSTKQVGPEIPDVSMARRMTTVYSTDYEGVDLSRVPMHKTKERMDLEEALTSDAPRPSLVDFVLNGEPQKAGKRSLTKIKDGTEMIAANANYEDLKEAVGPEAQYQDPDVTTLKERLFQLTIINPKGYFYAFWLNYIFLISLFTGLYTTLLAFFSTTPGQEMMYNGTAAESVDLLSIAGYMCDNSSSVYMSTCGSLTAFAEIADCIRGVGGTFGAMITAHDGGYGVVVPATYDISLVAYDPGSDEGRLHIFITYFIIDLSYYINIFVNLRTEVLTPNGFLTSFKDIFANYNKWNKLWIDVIAVFPLEILSPMFTCTRISKYHMMTFLRLNRLIYFLRYVPSSFTRWEYSLDVKIVRIRTLKFVVYIFTFTHMCSCYYYFWSCGYAMQSDLDRIEYKCRFGSWAWVFDVTYASNRAEDYIKTMYWASTTMTSTGYGDISASTTTGRLFALITMIIGTVMYGWLVAMIASTVSNTEAAEVSFRNSMLAMKHYLVVHSVPPPLVDRVLSVRRIEWERYQGTATPGIETIGRELPEQLHSVMMYESVNKFVEGLPFFHGVDSSFIAMLCNHVMIYHYSEGDVIIYEGDLSRNLYIIKQGHCDVITEDLEEIIDSLDPGDYFGETEVLFSCASPRTVVADTACEVLVLTRGDIDEVLQSFPILQAQMAKIEDDVKYRERVLHAIKRRNAGGKQCEIIGDRYNIAEIEGGTILFAERCEEPHVVRKLTGSNAQIEAATTTAGKIFSKLLLPLTLDPMSRPFLIYESLRIVLIFVTMIIVPIEFAFLPRHPAFMTVQYILDGLCLVDQYIRLHVSYYDDRAVIVTHPVQTAYHYIRTSFAIDLISWLPIELIAIGAFGMDMSEQQWRLVALLRILRCLQFYKVFAYFSYWFSDIRSSRRWLKHLSSALYAIIIHHTFACLLFISACPPENVNNEAMYGNMSSDMVVLNASGSDTFCHRNTWIGKIVDESSFPSLDLVRSVFDQYVISLYWATATLVCVGYGDIHATMQAEMFMATVVMICGTIYYSSILGDISANIQTDDIRRGHYKGRLSDILKFFKVYDVSKDTQRQVLDYYCYLWDRTRGVTPDYLLVGLPPAIRTSVCQSMYDPMIREAFDEGGPDTDKETQGFFRLMSTHIQPHLYLKQSIVCRRDDIGDEMFFIQRGNVAILEDDDETVSRVLGPGQHFGEVALMFATPRSRTIKALTNCDLNVLSKADLDDILSKFPRFRERMTRIAQDRKTHGTRSMTFDQEPSEEALARGSLYDVNGFRRDGSDQQKFTKILDRESKFCTYWKHLTILLVFFSSSMCVYQACFFNHSSQLYIVGYIMDVWFALDMIMSFHTSFLDEFSTNVDDRLKIHLKYGKSIGRFGLDAVGNAPIDIFAHFSTAEPATKLTILSILRLNRVLRMYRLKQIFTELESDIRKDALVFRVYKFILFVVFAINTMGGIFYAISCPMSQCSIYAWTSQSVTNYAENGIYGHTLLPWVDSLYWAVATMTSTGYGDITPQTQDEMLFSCFVMVLGKLMIGYVLGMVAATLANDESLRVWYEQSVTSVKRYMTDLSFQKELFEHVVHYYDYMWMKNQGVNVMELFPDLSFSLRADIYTQICRKMVDGIELFQGCPENFLRHLCMAMVPIAYMPGDYICLQGDIRNEMYVINHGVAEAMKRVEGKRVPIRLVMEGEHFLCESVLAKVRRPCSLRARTYVDVFSMTMESLQKILDYHPKARPVVLENARRLYPDLNL